MLKSGSSMKEVQKALNVHYSIVKKMAEKENIPVRSRKEAALKKHLIQKTPKIDYLKIAISLIRSTIVAKNAGSTT